MNFQSFPDSEYWFFAWLLALSTHADAGALKPELWFVLDVEFFCFLPQEIKEMRK